MNKTKISNQQIKHLAKLGNIDVKDDQVSMYATQIEEIVGFVEQLGEIDTKGVEPTYQVNDGTVNVFRDDVVTPSLSQSDATSQAKRVKDGYFVVDGVLNEG